MISPNEIIKNFKIDGELICIKPIGNGHINKTFLAEFDSGKYLLQEINTSIFKNAKELMSNICLVTNYYQNELKKAGKNPLRESMNVIYARSGLPYYESDDGKFYRVYDFIDDSICYEKVENNEQFYLLAKAFGNFAKVLEGFDASQLYETIPNFHNTYERYKTLEKSIELDVVDRCKLVQNEINFVKERKNYASRIVDLINEGKIPLKVTHNDTKLNNVLFDAKTKKPLAILDLDTIMPGSILYDFGDAIRFGCNTASENEKDLDKVKFDYELFCLFAKGYLESLGDSVNAYEKENLAFSAILITYECGIRFLTDYLDGDKYFGISYKEENIDRARTQFKLVSEMESMYSKMQEYVKNL